VWVYAMLDNEFRGGTVASIQGHHASLCRFKALFCDNARFHASNFHFAKQPLKNLARRCDLVKYTQDCAAQAVPPLLLPQTGKRCMRDFSDSKLTVIHTT
jgi:hypothetical protein